MAASGKKFRWEIVGALLAILFVAWLLDSARVAFEWADVMQWLGVRNTERFTRLCVLAVSLISALAVVRVLRSKPEN